MFLRKSARSSESQENEWGPSVIYFGIGLAVLSLIIVWWSIISETGPAAGRTTNLMIFGVPTGIILIIIGAMKAFRDRRR